jgi:hypothetical protein
MTLAILVTQDNYSGAFVPDVKIARSHGRGSSSSSSLYSPIIGMAYPKRSSHREPGDDTITQEKEGHELCEMCQRLISAQATLFILS